MLKNKRKLLNLVLTLILCASFLISASSFLNTDNFIVKADSSNLKIIAEYLDKANALTPESDYQEKAKAKLVVYLTNLKENFHTLSGSEKTSYMNNLKGVYYEYYNDYLYGDVQQSKLIMSLGAISDPHITAVDYPTNFSTALTDLRNLRPELSAVMITGDLSEDGISAWNDENSNLDDYYDFISNLNY
ncbi:MAG: metallophosphoesterase, partial [Clostridia bacterium]|nr:metallophosphoesterase [Clostridia bacterium]